MIFILLLSKVTPPPALNNTFGFHLDVVLSLYDTSCTFYYVLFYMIFLCCSLQLGRSFLYCYYF